MRKLLIATENQAKKEQFKFLFSDWNVKLYFLDDFNFNIKIIEDGKTAQENAEIKVRAFLDKVDMPVLGDDAGIEIEALNNEPGLQARRWNGLFDENVCDEKWLDYLLNRLRKSENKSNEGRYRAAWVVGLPKGPIFHKEVIIPFKISHNKLYPYPKGNPMAAIELHPQKLVPVESLTKTERYLFLKDILDNWVEVKRFFKTGQIKL